MLYAPQDLFQLQSELVEAKVDMAVNNKIGEVIAQIHALKDEMRNDMQEIRTEIHDLRHDMMGRFSALDNRLIAVETKLGMVNDTKDKVKGYLINYAFQGSWIVFLFIGALLFQHLHWY